MTSTVCLQAQSDLNITSKLQHRDDDRWDHVDRLRGDRERQETTSHKRSASPHDYKVGGWVVLHRRAFGDQAKFNGRKLNKLERLEAYGPYRVVELKAKGRIKVELQREWSGQKTNEFSLHDVRRYYTRRPWDFDQISLEQHLEETWDVNREYEVDHVVARKYNRRTYTYQVKFTCRTCDVLLLNSLNSRIICSVGRGGQVRCGRRQRRAGEGRADGGTSWRCDRLAEWPSYRPEVRAKLLCHFCDAADFGDFEGVESASVVGKMKIPGRRVPRVSGEEIALRLRDGH
jgi:hypothetical protein